MRIAKHGTVGEYTNHGCRCEVCAEAKRAYYGRTGRPPLPDSGDRLAAFFARRREADNDLGWVESKPLKESKPPLALATACCI